MLSERQMAAVRVSHGGRSGERCMGHLISLAV
jgi:hypothetical protein